MVRLTIALLFVAASFSAKSQYYYYDNDFYEKDVIWEIGGGGGIMKGITDVGAERIPLLWKNANGNFSVYVGVMYKNVVGVRLEGTWGQVEGYDKDAKDSGVKSRNLNYRSLINEISLIGEFHPLMMKAYPDGPPKFSPYIAAGLGWFSFNPQASIGGRWYDLQPLQTEGRGFDKSVNNNYNLSQSNISAGIGVKYEASQLISVRAELMHRFLFTDYLDDVSTTYIDPALFDQHLSAEKAALARALFNRTGVDIPPGNARGNPKSNDAYITFNLKVGINLGRTRRN